MIETKFNSLTERAQVSDLFFNHEHPTYNSLFGDDKEPPTRERIRAAIRKDADDFAASFGGDPEWYADDFMKRL